MKNWLGKTILEEVASDVHNLGYELATEQDFSAFKNHVFNVLLGTAVSGGTEKLSKLLNSPIIDAGPQDSSTGIPSHIDSDTTGTKSDTRTR